MGKKAQVAMESLMIYGVAILIVMLAIGGLIYFGVLDMGSMLPDKCSVAGAAFNCESFSIGKTGNVKVEITNNVGKNLQSIQLRRCEETERNDLGALLTGTCTSAVNFVDSTGAAINSGAPLLNGELAYTQTMGCNVVPNIKTGSKVKLTCQVQYQISGSNLARDATINVITTVVENN